MNDDKLGCFVSRSILSLKSKRANLFFPGREGATSEGEEPGQHEEVHGRAEEHGPEAEQEAREAEETARDAAAGDHQLHQEREFQL